MASRARGRKPKGADEGSQVPLPFEGEQGAAGVAQRSPDTGVVSSTQSHPLNGEQPPETAPKAAEPLARAEGPEPPPASPPGIESVPSEGAAEMEERASQPSVDALQGTDRMVPNPWHVDPTGSSRAQVPGIVPGAEFGIPVDQLVALYDALKPLLPEGKVPANRRRSAARRQGRKGGHAK